ncbi:MAG: response regulator transcription factor, partial [Nanoarchaeota archaeon]
WSPGKFVASIGHITLEKAKQYLEAHHAKNPMPSGIGVVNFAGAFASRDGERLHLNRSEYKILESLLLSPSLGLSNTQLYRAYSGYFDDFIVGCGQTVKVHIYRLRNKLGKDGDNIISINSYGYKIDPAAVEFFPKPASIIDLPFVRTA